MITNSNTHNQGLPWRLPCTYDIIAFDQYNTTTFNSLVYLAALRAGKNLADALGDSETAKKCDAAFIFGQGKVYSLLWNSTHEYFRAYTGGDAIHGDCLYGQMVAHHNGLGWLVDPEKLSAHLVAEFRYNSDKFGIKVVTGRHEPPPEIKFPSRRSEQGMARVREMKKNLGYDGQDDVIWLGGAPDWSYLRLALAREAAQKNSGTATLSLAEINSALAITEAQLSNFRDRLKDLWNIVGIISPSDWGSEDSRHGMPYVTSHYGFVMTDYYLPSVISGQSTDFPNGKLTFSPLYPCPFNFPVTLMNFLGKLTCNNGIYSFSAVFGSIILPVGGLSVNNNTYAPAVSLVAGQTVSW
jgi:hypothetical protein